MGTQYTDYSVVSSGIPASRRLSWSGIFSGTFLFLAIEATFGVLGVAIFASAVNPRSANPVSTGIGVGSGIWMVVLSIIALYFAGKLASTQSGTMTRNSGMYAGLVTFGMCIFAVVLMLFLAPWGATRASALTADQFVTVGGYWLFATLILGAIAAASGGIHGSMTSGGRPSLERPAETKRVA